MKKMKEKNNVFVSNYLPIATYSLNGMLYEILSTPVPQCYSRRRRTRNASIIVRIITILLRIVIM